MTQPLEVPARAPWRWRLLLVWLAGVVVIGLVAGYLASTSRSGSSDDPIHRIHEIAPAKRLPAAALSGQLVGGGSYDPAAYRGRITVINAWGSWCEPCRAELPVLRSLATATYPAPVAFLGLDVADTRSGAAAMERRYALPYPSLYDADKAAYAALAPSLADNVPSTIVLDAKGRVAAFVIGSIDKDQMTAYLRKLAGEPAG